MAAQTLVQKGHCVTLFEKGESLGGLLKDATAAPFKEYLRNYLQWDIRTTLNCGAEIRLNTEVTVETIEKENPDAVIVATGSKYLHPPIPGIDNRIVKMVRDVESRSVEVGETVLVCGGGLTGLECALTLGMEGKDVTVIDMIPTEHFCKEMPIFNKADLFNHLEEYGVKLIGNRKILSFIDSGAETEDKEGNRILMEADTCVIALGVVPENTLGKKLLSQYGPDVHLIGDCVSKGRTFYHANQEAYHTAMLI